MLLNTLLNNPTTAQWLIDNPTLQFQVFDYAVQNSFSTQSQQFVQQCVTQMQQNPGIFTSISPFIIEKNIDDSQLDPCTKGILDKLKNLQQEDIAMVFARFKNPNNTFNMSINQGSITAISGNIRLAETNSSTGNIVLNNNYFNNTGATHLIKAEAILHEMIHSLIFSIVNNANNANNVDPTNFSEIWNAYILNEFGNNNNEHHVFMGQHYVEIIGAALQEYDTGIPVPNGQAPLQLYTDLAWAGLLINPLSSASTPFDSILTSADKLRIYGRLHAELNRANFSQTDTNPSSTNPCLN